MGEEHLIKRKLLLDSDGTGDDKKLQIFIKQLTKFVYSDVESPEEIEASYNKLVAQLHSFQLSRRKFDLSNRCNVQQLSKFQTIQAIFEKRTELIRNDIEKQQKLLKRARVVKRNHVEYDLLVKTVKKHPCRGEVLRKHEKLQKELRDLEKEREHLGNKWNGKVKQCHVLSTSANAIKNNLKEFVWETSPAVNSDVSQPDLEEIVVMSKNCFPIFCLNLSEDKNAF